MAETPFPWPDPEDIAALYREHEQRLQILQESEEKLRTIFLLSPDPIVINRFADGTVLDVNDAFLEQTGYSRAEVAGTTAVELGLWEEAETRARFRERLERDGQVRDLEGRFRRKDGALRTGLLSSRLLALGGERVLVSVLRDVTERQRMADALTASEAQFRLLAAHIGDVIWTMDLDLRLTYVSPSVEKVFGWPPERFVTLGPEEYLTPPSLQAARALLAEELARHGTEPDRHVTFEIEQVRRDGTPFWTEVSARLVAGDNGAPAGIIGSTRDISARRRAEEELRRSRERYRELVEGANSVILRWDTAGRILFMNPFGLRLFGYAEEELIGRSVMGTIVADHAADGRDLAEMIRGIIADPAAFVRNENENLCRDGRRVWINWTNKAVFDAEGRYREILSVGNDVTERKHAEEALRASAHELRTLVENLPRDSFLYRHGTDGVFSYVSPSVTDLLGYSPAEFCRHYTAYLTDDPVNRSGVAHTEAALRGVRQPPYEVEVRHKDGSVRRLQVNESPVCDHAGAVTGVTGIAVDVTERRRLEAQLAQAQKIESVGRLAGGVAHDFNNMLSPILGYAELLREGLPRGSAARERAEAIAQAAERCRDLVRQLLAFARRQTLEMRPLDLNAVVGGFVGMLRRTLREDVTIEVRAGSPLGPVLGDARQIEQVILNLALNAQDAMPAGGTLLIATEEVFLDEAFARGHRWMTPGLYVSLAVSDTGTGMDREVMEKMFDPFFTTKESGSGTGLGLAMVYGIVKQHGGSVLASSEPGRGTTIRLYLPRSASPRPRPEDAREAAPPRGGSETILLVEDEEQVRALVAEVLRRGGYTVLTAACGAEGLEAAAGHPGRIDLLLTDVVLPDFNGRALHERLAAAGVEHAVLYLSGYPAEVIGRHGVLEEGVDFLQKPFAPAELSARVREVLDRSRPAEA